MDRSGQDRTAVDKDRTGQAGLDIVSSEAPVARGGPVSERTQRCAVLYGGMLTS